MADVQVVVGPVSSASALAWVEFARSVLADRGDALPSDARDAFVGYMAEWEQLATHRATVEWQALVPVEVGEYLVLAFYRLAQQVDADRPGPEAVVPEEATPFYLALVDGLLDAMAEAGAGSAEFSDHLRGFWPRQPEQ